MKTTENNRLRLNKENISRLNPNADKQKKDTVFTTTTVTAIIFTPFGLITVTTVA